MWFVMAAKAAIYGMRELKLRSCLQNSTIVFWLSFKVCCKDLIRQLPQTAVDGRLRGHDDILLISILKFGATV